MIYILNDTIGPTYSELSRSRDNIFCYAMLCYVISPTMSILLKL